MSFPKTEIEALWSPWRVEYYDAEHRDQPDFLLAAAAAPPEEDKAHLVVARARTGFLIMNKYPYACGHLMACPNRKVSTLEELDAPEILDLWKLALLGQAVLREVVRAQGFNIGVNIGPVAGAGIAHHLHIHIVPRWSGDSNFMPVIANTRILPQALEPLYDRLREALPGIEAFNQLNCA